MIEAFSIVKSKGTSSSIVSTVVGGVLRESSVCDEEWDCEDSPEENSRSTVAGLPPAGLPPASRFGLGDVAGKQRSTLAVRRSRAWRLRSEGVLVRMGEPVLGELGTLLAEPSGMVLSVLARLREPVAEGGED
jgi:hypothetical protein